MPYNSVIFCERSGRRRYRRYRRNELGLDQVRGTRWASQAHQGGNLPLPHAASHRRRIALECPSTLPYTTVRCIFRSPWRVRLRAGNVGALESCHLGLCRPSRDVVHTAESSSCNAFVSGPSSRIACTALPTFLNNFAYF